MPELMHPYHAGLISETLDRAGYSESLISIDNAIQAVIENQTDIDGVRPNLDNSETWDEVEYLVIDRLGFELDLVKAY